MSLKRLHRLIKPVNHWALLVAGIVSALICTGALRHNNLTALRLRDEVLKADQQNQDVEAPLQKLRIYIYSHMNTNLASGPNAIRPPVQLKYRYERLTEAEKGRVGVANAKLYTEAQADCERRFPQGLSGSGRIPCIQEYVTTHGGEKEQPIPDSLYKFDFISPFWSPDLAGWTMIISMVCFLLFAFRYGLERWVRAELRNME